MDYSYNMYIDDLTGLPNLKGLYKDFQNEDLDGKHFIYVDIDDYNKMNIVFGIDTVEDMLIQLASTLQDYCGKSTVYRVGNDQFLIVTDSIFICEPSELQRLLKTPFHHHDMRYVINASVCVIDYDDFPGDSLHDILNLAFITHDFARASGRNALVHATKQHKERYELINEMEYHIHEALEEDHFYPMYRPFVDTFTYEVVGFEATSWWDLNGRTIKAREFLEIAEWTGGIYDIEMRMFERALEFYRQLQDDKTIKLSPRFKAGVHLSLLTLLRLEIDDITKLLVTFEVPARDVILLIDEKNVNDEAAYQKIQNLYELGFVVVLDNYSNSTSSLSYLVDLKVDVLKLSKSLLDNINDSEEYKHTMSVYKFFVDISQQFDMAVVSSGIKTKRDLELVKDLGVNIGTGEYFLEPVTAPDFHTYLMESKKRKKR
jgi:EAL domain-containing protein (putative c-di-GMP-specific phosphodiesterase class I)/GGDEF domain-containing protein